MRKFPFWILWLTVLFCNSAAAQYGTRVIVRGRPHPYPAYQPRQARFEPSLSLSLGYGFPNLDKFYFPDFDNTFKNSSSQMGPLLGSLDYQFNRRMSVGVMVTHGNVNTNYYYYGSGQKAFSGQLDNWSVMLDLIHYFPSPENFKPYFRTALGVNIWNQQFTDPQGNQAVLPNDPAAFAYQVSLGARIKITHQLGLFAEAGFGKYILNTGLSFRLN